MADDIKYNQTGNGGWYTNPDEYVPTSWQKIKGHAGEYANLATEGLNVLGKFVNAKNLKDAKMKGIRPRLYGPAYTKIAPVTGLPQEVKQAALDNIAQLKPRMGMHSDPTQTMQERKQMWGNMRDAQNRLVTLNAQTALQSKQMHDQALTQQQERNAMLRMQNQDKLEAADKARAAVEADYVRTKGNIWTDALNNLSTASAAEGQNQYAAELKRREEQINQFKNNVDALRSQQSAYEPTSEAYMTLGKDINNTNQQWQDYIRSNPIKSPSQVRRGIFGGYKNGGKLVRRTR